MDKKFPPELLRFAAQAHVKKAFISDVQPTVPSDCPNCGGAQVIALFCAMNGPFQAPAPPYQKYGEGDNAPSITSHFDQTVGANGAWWTGITVTFACPVCKDNAGRKLPPPKKDFVQQAMKHVEEKISL